VLIDINMDGFLPNSLWVEREKYSSEIEIEYEKPPYFCFNCNSISHSSDQSKNDLVNTNAIEKVVTKIDPVKPKQNYVPKRNVDQVQGRSKPVAFEDPLVFDIIRSKEVTFNEFIRDLIIFEEELIPSSFVGTVPMQSVQVVDDLTIDMAEKRREDHQSDKFPDLRIVGPWCDAVTDLDYTQDSSPLCGSLPSRNDVLNPIVAHDLEILQQHFLKGRDATARLYTDEEEREAAINYLRNRSAVSEEPFIEVDSRATKKKNKHKGFRVHNTHSGGRLPN
jgi:hypothetical protein